MNHIPRSLVAATAVVALLALSGCSGDKSDATVPSPKPSATATNSPVEDPTESATAKPSSVPTPTISADPETGKFDWCNPEEQEPFTGEAADKFGAEKVMDAYCSMVEMQMEQSFVDSLLRKDKGFSERDFAAVRNHLAQNARDVWDKNVAAIVAGRATDQQAANVRGLVNYNFTGDSGYTLDVPAVFNQRFTPAQAWIAASEGRPKLALRFTVGADVALVRDSDEKEMAFAYDKTITYWLVENVKGDAWYIDGIAYERAESKPVKREALIKPTG